MNRKTAVGFGILCIVLATILAVFSVNDMTIIRNKDSQLAALNQQKSILLSCLEGNITEYWNYVGTHNYTNSDYESYISARIASWT